MAARRSREYVVHPGAVLIVPILPDGRLVLERQFRYPVGRVMLEFPAGKIDPDESPLATAKRELREEVGYTADAWQPLGIVHPEIGVFDRSHRRCSWRPASRTSARSSTRANSSRSWR